VYHKYNSANISLEDLTVGFKAWHLNKVTIEYEFLFGASFKDLKGIRLSPHIIDPEAC
jgi:hypothetical protein